MGKIAARHYAIIMFLDIRGFTQWSERTEASYVIQEFMSDFYNIFSSLPGLDKKKTFVKPNGDGVVIIHLLKSSRERFDNLNTILHETIPHINDRFKDVQLKYLSDLGYSINLKLGYGISAGYVFQIELHEGRNKKTDFLSSDINKAARLCNEARPEGIIISRDAFYDFDFTQHGFYEHELAVKGIAERIRVMASSETDIVQKRILPAEVMSFLDGVLYEYHFSLKRSPGDRERDVKFLASEWKVIREHQKIIINGTHIADRQRDIKLSYSGLARETEDGYMLISLYSAGEMPYSAVHELGYHKEEVYCRYQNPLASSEARQVIGIYTAIDHMKNAISGPTLLSKDKLLDDEAAHLLKQNIYCFPDFRVIGFYSTKFDNDFKTP